MWRDDVATQLMWSNEVDSKANVIAGFISIASTYCPEYTLTRILDQVEGAKGLIKYDEDDNSIHVVADGAQVAKFKFHLEIDEKYGLIAVVKGEELQADSEEEWVKFHHRLLRIGSGWIDLNEDWKSKVSMSTYDVKKEGKDFVYTLYWVKDNTAIFGYGHAKDTPKDFFSIRGWNHEEGKAVLRLREESEKLTKQTEGDKIIWQGSEFTMSKR